MPDQHSLPPTGPVSPSNAAQDSLAARGPASSSGIRSLRWGSLSALSYLVVLVIYSQHYLSAAFSRSWFFSSDEYTIAQEVIRFLSGDFHQRFFDMPGTPLMMLATLLWSGFYELARLTGSAGSGIIEFTYAHLAGLFNTLRGITLFFHACSLVLLFLLTRRLLNQAGAWLSCLILMMSPIFASYSSFCRVESMAISCVLAGLLIIYRAFDRNADTAGRPSWRDPFLLAGILVGIAAGLRLHSVAASLPLVTLILFFHERPPQITDYPKWTRSAARYALPLIGLAGIACIWEATRRIIGYPWACRLITRAGIGLAILPVAALVLHRSRAMRPFLLRIASPEWIKIMIGCGCGFLLGNPTAFPQYRFVLDSMNGYSGTYIDWGRVAWPFWTDLRWYVAFYWKAFAPDTVAALLMLAGSVWIVARRDRRLLPYLCAFVLLFLSQPIDLRAAAHHVLLWLPFFAIVCAYPFAALFDILRRQTQSSPQGRIALQCGAACAFLLIAVRLTNGPLLASEQVHRSQRRLDHVAEATDWLKHNTPADAAVGVGYFCFNPDIFYFLMHADGVPVPGHLFDGREYSVWWGDRKSLAGRAGYLCAPGVHAETSPLDRLAAGKNADLADPVRDSGFQTVGTFGDDALEIDVFRFDFRGKSAADRPAAPAAR